MRAYPLPAAALTALPTIAALAGPLGSSLPESNMRRSHGVHGRRRRKVGKGRSEVASRSVRDVAADVVRLDDIESDPICDASRRRDQGSALYTNLRYGPKWSRSGSERPATVVLMPTHG